MNIALWIVQGLMAVFFLFAGGMKLFAFETYKKRSEERTGHDMGFSKGFLQFIGVCEVLGGLGLILPMALGITPVLTTWAAVGLTIIMLGASIFHMTRKEPPVTLVIVALTAFVVWGRGFSL